VGGFQGLVHDTGQVILDRVQVHGVFQPGRERGHGLVGIVAGAVEPPVHRALHPPPQRVEQRGGGQRGGGHRHHQQALARLGYQVTLIPPGDGTPPSAMAPASTPPPEAIPPVTGISP
jgi:hypothetical protein